MSHLKTFLPASQAVPQKWTGANCISTKQFIALMKSARDSTQLPMTGQETRKISSIKQWISSEQDQSGRSRLYPQAIRAGVSVHFFDFQPCGRLRVCSRMVA